MSSVPRADTEYSIWWRASTSDEDDLPSPVKIAESILKNQTELFSNELCPECPKDYSSCNDCRTIRLVSIPQVAEVRLWMQCEIVTHKHFVAINKSDVMSALVNGFQASEKDVQMSMRGGTGPFPPPLSPNSPPSSPPPMSLCPPPPK